ncbi:MAG: response regulator [Ruminiclostridium sp.]|nr:response regulator [Ruminiclostridium sp.]
MEKNVLLISDGGGFMIDALANNLKKTAGFNVIKVSPYDKEIKADASGADILLLYAGDYIQNCSDILAFLKDMCDENNKTLCVIGYDRELDVISGTIPDSSITRKFKRPFDMRKLAEELASVSDPDTVKAPEASKHILLVDDDGAFLKMMQIWLSPYYHVTIVNSGMQAITYIAKNTPDLILLDYDMPITPGPQVLEMIRSEPDSANIPVIFLTGKSDSDSIDKVMRLDPQGYLLKSMPKQEILDAVDNYFVSKEWKFVR